MVRFAVVGTSAITARFLDALALEQGAVLHAVYSRTKQRAQAFGAQYGARAYYDSLQALAADENVDAVYIASPNSLHCAQALCMLRAGKHVLCEKPMAATARQARQMFTAAEENGVVLMEAMRSLYAPGFARLRGLVQAVGPVRRATLSYSKYSSRYELVRRGEPTNIFHRRADGPWGLLRAPCAGAVRRAAEPPGGGGEAGKRRGRCRHDSGLL